ncbi:hypothetical protein IGI04_034533 [Brassica rapa subsp. trilocularis]|uniref:SKP1 component dimerisation domain-containing protein n=1 Tax=Brassica rapa subsp. trilocularis TaxID=1813537 RepID=A0ABQ7L924_BRACM|nr:hypothetical protein IGI04_034533 [Brassica rapa subsp. trilocularis]
MLGFALIHCLLTTLLVKIIYTAKEEFENLCLILGIELDAVTTEKAIIRKEKHIEEEEADDDEEVIYK